MYMRESTHLAVRRVVISPHLDDAVFGCGEWLAAHPGATVVTVFAGMPADRRQQTPWDSQCGFQHAKEAMTERWVEDLRALSLVRAEHVWLDFCDGQYGPSVSPAHLADKLLETFKNLAAQEIVMPLGLFHPDHVLVHEAMVLASPHLTEIRVSAYEDAVYRMIPGVLQQRLVALAAAGIRATPYESQSKTTWSRAKRAAVGCYSSQLKAIPPEQAFDLLRPERFWVLAGEPLGPVRT
jgi:LmbE family N-acetylglucosaminyl deacetylase